MIRRGQHYNIMIVVTVVTATYVNAAENDIISFTNIIHDNFKTF